MAQKAVATKSKMIGTINMVVVHCSATPNGKVFHAADIHRWHLDRGFAGIGYHKVILPDGSVELGRPEYWIGSHAAPYNDNSLSVCMIGTDQFSREQFDSLAAILTSWKAKYGSGIKIVGHRDLSPDKNGNGVIEKNEWLKLCPGFDVAQFLKTRGIQE